MRAALGLIVLFAAVGCTPKGTPVAEILSDVEPYLGKTITIRTKLRSGARCHIGEEEGQWVTYCKGDCQYCKGPLVVDPGTPMQTESDWPMILGGTWEYKDIRCKGPLNAIECHPFEMGKWYVIRGRLEAHRPPRLLVSKWWPVEE